MPKKDVFPQTLRTWIGSKLQEGDDGRAEVNRHVMTVYALPLQVYFRGSADRWLGEAEDIVNGFFADRLERPDFFLSWQESGLRLRRWLMNALSFYLKELRRGRRRTRREEAFVEEAQGVGEDVARQIDRAFAVSTVEQALRMAEETCRRQDLTPHWRLFHRHYYEGLPYNDVLAEFGVDAVRAATMARTVAGKFRRALRELLSRDGATESELNAEIETLLEVTGE